eukprot:Gregarina_sp_Poly_1__4576@NODE_2453_length_2119_cov_253_382554_g1555_i0_p1_GENE_NODE_2453_length_2119_cov_253_382554_g1555_i0NODE_2453_length_2119_cov_253_382554_g1555_i0_p1_ORF_typecomplete_len283_score22_30_NODE_2453_length_2119_cov_253_382554_g1555_i03011149
MTKQWIVAYISATAIPILRNARVVLNCADATGAIACDWECYDACVSSQASIYLTADQMEACVDRIHKPCVVPAVAHNTVLISEFCSIHAEGSETEDESMAMEQFSLHSSGYLFEIPRISNQGWKWRMHRSHVQSASVDIDGAFDAQFCLVPSKYKITSASVPIIRNPKGYCVEREEDSKLRESESVDLNEQFDTSTSFGFRSLNINFTQWARNYESNFEPLGAVPLNIRLSAVNTCWAPADNATLYYSVNFAIHTAELNSSPYSFSLQQLPQLLLLLVFVWI